MVVFCTSCEGQNKPDPQKENIKPETKDTVTSPRSNETYHTKYEYTDSIGKSLIIQNSFPRGILYTAPNGKEYAKATFWTRIINETDNPLELTIDFYVVRLLIKPKSGWLRVKDDGNGTTRAGFSLKGQNIFYTLNGKEIHCGKINLKNLILKK
jgi:hypothetical protein